MPTARVELKAVNIYTFSVGESFSTLWMLVLRLAAATSSTFVFLMVIRDDAPLKLASAGVDLVTLNPPTGGAEGGRRCFFREPKTLWLTSPRSPSNTILYRLIRNLCYKRAWWWWYHKILYTKFVVRNPDLHSYTYISMFVIIYSPVYGLPFPSLHRPETKFHGTPR